jgi:RNA polymerase sigma-70 factor (ECF subfamily)
MSRPTSENDMRLSQIQTNWTEVFGGVFGQEAADVSVQEAQRDLLIRYARPVYKYLLAAVRDTNVADDLAQQFAFRIIRGDFKNANPQRGRFRDFIKRALRNLVTDHFRRQAKSPLSLTPEFVQVADSSGENNDQEFDERWRREILAQTWKAMDRAETEKPTSYVAVLRAKALHPEENSTALASRLSEELDRDINAAWLRQTLRRARLRFNDLLRQEVQRTINSDNEDDVQTELADLGLLKYTRV